MPPAHRAASVISSILWGARKHCKRTGSSVSSFQHDAAGQLNDYAKVWAEEPVYGYPGFSNLQAYARCSISLSCNAGIAVPCCKACKATVENMACLVQVQSKTQELQREFVIPCRMSIVQGDSGVVCPSVALAFYYDVNLQASYHSLLTWRTAQQHAVHKAAHHIEASLKL